MFINACFPERSSGGWGVKSIFLMNCYASFRVLRKRDIGCISACSRLANEIIVYFIRLRFLVFISLWRTDLVFFFQGFLFRPFQLAFLLVLVKHLWRSLAKTETTIADSESSNESNDDSDEDWVPGSEEVRRRNKMIKRFIAGRRDFKCMIVQTAQKETIMLLNGKVIAKKLIISPVWKISYTR